MTPDIKKLLDNPNPVAVLVPKRNEIMNCKDVEDIKKLTPSTTQSIRTRNFLPVPPFLVNVIESTILISGGDAKVILKEVITSIKMFNENHAEDGEYIRLLLNASFWVVFSSTSSKP